MKTPSFFELKTFVEYINEELADAQLQEVNCSPEGVVLSFYRFTKEPKAAHLLFDLDKPFPFVGFFYDNPWGGIKKTKPLGLFMKAHAVGLRFQSAEVYEDLGRVVKFFFGENFYLEFRVIPKQTNLIAATGKNSISWYAVKELAQNDIKYTQSEEEIRSIAFMQQQWLLRRGKKASSQSQTALSPYDKWKKARQKDLEKKQKAMCSIQEQIDKLQSEPWIEIGEFLKENSINKIPPEWSGYIDFKKSNSQNMQNCFAKAKAAKSKLLGAEQRKKTLFLEIQQLADLSENKFSEFIDKPLKKNNIPARPIEGKLRKMMIPERDIVAYMGKSAADNMYLLRKSKPHDIWLHLKDYPSAHSIAHLQKNQKISDIDIKKIATWLLRETLSEKQKQMGGKFAVVYVECRHVKPIKGDKLGRVSYHNAHEVLIAL